jgi:hypothetical protein
VRKCFLSNLELSLLLSQSQLNILPFVASFSKLSIIYYPKVLHKKPKTPPFII